MSIHQVRTTTFLSATPPTIFRLQVYERVGISLLEGIYIGKAVISV